MLPSQPKALKKLTHKKSLLAALPRKSSLSQFFHENTKLGPLTGRAYAAATQAFLLSRRTRELIARAYKTYTLFDRIELPALTPRSDLEKVVAARRSVRSYTPEGISLEELSRLLFFSYGRTSPQDLTRMAGSGGALYPLELYVVPRNVQDLAVGIYHYNIEDHCLEIVTRGDHWDAVTQELHLGGIDVEGIAVLVILTAIFRRTTTKYEDRGYRLLLMETGAVAHNLCLMATSLGLGACQIGGFHDDNLSEILALDGLEEAPLLAVVVGRAPTSGGEP